MDSQRFDDVFRTLAAATSRRRILKLLAGGAISSAVALLRPDGADAACRALRQPCTRGTQCCTGRCSARGRCVCPVGRQRCGDRCCPAGKDCCNFSCSICTAPDQGCIAVICE